MLSLRGRQEGAGFRGMADDVELEEGEACPDGGGGRDFVDPDVALSYIDEKLQHVLGHFQKDFEGGVCAENLGSKFGGYGSFLPTCQRSPPPLPRTRSSPNVGNISTSRSPYQQSAESMGQNPSTVAVKSIPRNNGSGAPSSGDLCKKERCSSTNGEKDSVVCSDSLDSSFNGSDQKTFKVRIKVGSNNGLTRKNAAIYSGLGLDISSSSSMEESPDGLEGFSPEFSNVPYESPRTILQIMTCFSVPGGFLLSPLRGDILQLTNKVAPLLKKWDTHLDSENVPRTFEGHPEPSLPLGHVRGHVAKKMKSGSKKKKSIDTKSKKDIDHTSAIMNKEVNIETSACQEIISDTPNIPCLSGVPTTEFKGVSQFAEESTRNACISRPSEQNKEVRLREQIGGNDLATVKAEATKHIETGSFDNSGTGYLEKGKVKLKTSKVEMGLEERNMTNRKHSPFDRKKEIKVRPERKFEAAIVDFEGNEDKIDWDVGPCDDLKKAPGKETFASERIGEDNSRTEVKRMQKEHKINAEASSNFLEDDSCIHSSAAVKDRKNDSLKSNHFEKKVRAKFHKDLGENLHVRYQGDKEGDLLENRSAQSELRRKEDDNEKEFDISGTARKEIPASVKRDRFPASEEQQLHMPSISKRDRFPASEEQQLHMPSISGTATTNAAPLPAPVVIKEHWVCCDMCQKWRLLPYGTNPSMLPKKWKCSMLNWLPGMNRCDISEDETTDALNALYVTPVPATGVSSGVPHTAAAGTATSSTYNISGHLEQSRKRKNALKDGNGMAESSYPMPASIPLMRNQQVPTKNKKTVDGEHYPFEGDSVSKHGLGPVSRSADFVVEKQKSKHKNRSSYSDGGDLMEKSKKHSKSKNKRGIDRDEHKTSKKTKKEDQRHFDRDWNNECDLFGGEVPDETKTWAAKAKGTKSSPEQGDISLDKEKVSLRYDFLEKPRRISDEDAAFCKENKEHPADVERLDLSGKKKTSKEWEGSQHNPMAHESKGAKNENLKERKPKIMKSEEMTSKVDSRPGKFPDADTVLPSAGGHLNNELVADNKFVTGKEGPSELWENLPPRQALDLAEPTRRDVAYLQSSAVATSSSSKISSSQRNKNSQEAKGSPVESVSSSPLRNFNIEKISRGRNSGKDGALDADSSAMHSPVKYPSIEVGVVYNGQRSRNFEESQAAGEPILHGSLQGSSDSNNKEVAQLARTQAYDITHLERGLDNNLPKESWRKDLAANDSGVARGDSHLSSGDKKGLDMHGPSPQRDQHNLFDPRTTALDAESDPIVHESKNSAPSRQGRNGSSHFLSHGNKQSEMSTGRQKSQPRIDNQDMQKPIAQVVHSHKEGKSEVHSTPVKSDASKMKGQLRRSNVENGVQHGTVKQAIYNPSDTASPVRKDGSMVAFALNEARDLKHKANHLKDKGQELESTVLCFEAALKFLHVASLLETPSFDSSRPGDAAKSMKMYSETAKLCDVCAHAYERCKKMAAAALAYKCVEVAYLKAAYYKHPSASKERQELQAIVQIARGESPSSSASDIDNLNSHGLSKATSTKNGNSPQVAGNHLPLAVRNQAHLLRLLAYTNDVNSAFDATRKSQVAIASAAGNREREKGVDDGLASVRTVLDFNFNNVNELLRLVRLSMESISS